MKRIGPYLTVSDDNYLPRMQDAYDTDNERGSHALNNHASEMLGKQWPTVLAMAALIEQQRDELLEKLSVNQQPKESNEQSKSSLPAA
jgi:hypothetical protein